MGNLSSWWPGIHPSVYLPWGVLRLHLWIGCSRDSGRKYLFTSSCSPWIKGSPLSLQVSHFQSCTSTRIAGWVPTSPKRWQLRICKVTDTQCSQVRFCGVISAPAGCCSNGCSLNFRQKEHNFKHKRKLTQLVFWFQIWDAFYHIIACLLK